MVGDERQHAVARQPLDGNFYGSAGRTGEAIELEERVLADRVRLLGAEHPDTLTARADLAASYGSAGRRDETMELLEQVLGDRKRLLGAEHPDARDAETVLQAWRSEDAT